jgi:cbb3-type cytochrome oxidase subunit 3
LRNEYYLFKEQEKNIFDNEKNDLSEKTQITQKKMNIRKKQQ